MNVRLGVHNTISDVHWTRLSLFFKIVKIEPKIGYDFGRFVALEEEERFLELDFKFAKIKNKKGIIMHKRIEAEISA